MQSINILFTSAGRRVSLIQLFRKALLNLGYQQSVIVTSDYRPQTSASFVADFHEVLPLVSDSEYIDQLLNICVKHQIKLLIPLIDTELLQLALNASKFQEIGVQLLLSSVATNKICIDKRETYRFFKEIGVQTAEIFDPDSILKNKSAAYPVIVKPATGSASESVTLVKNTHELRFFTTYIPNAIVQEYLIGQEYTIDVLTDFQGSVRCIVPRVRLQTRAGETSQGMTVKNRELMQLAQKIVEALPGVAGCLCLQCFILPDQSIKFIEINPRFGGGFPLSCHAGANFPQWIIDLTIGRNIQVGIDHWEEGVSMFRYDEAFYTGFRKQ